MSAPKIEIVNPIRFFSFFGLFLIFLFLAFRSCSDQQEGTKYVDANEVAESQAANLKKANSEELSEFITDIKKDLKKTDAAKDLSAAELAKLEDQNRAVKAKQKIKKNKEAAAKKAAAAKKKTAALKKKADALKAKVAEAKKAKALVKQKIIVKSQDGRLSPFSKLQLKQTVGGSSKPFSKIMIYGYYGMDQPKGKAFVKAAEIKNTLIGLGVKRSVPIYMLTEQTRLPDAMGKVIFSQ